jgi:hypothetical protein
MPGCSDARLKSDSLRKTILDRILKLPLLQKTCQQRVTKPACQRWSESDVTLPANYASDCPWTQSTLIERHLPFNKVNE